MVTKQQIREDVLDMALKPENLERFEGVLRVTVVVCYGSMVLAVLEVSGFGGRKYYGAAYDGKVRFSQESFMDEGHALEWGMWERF